jgi:hypothetical protein
LYSYKTPAKRLIRKRVDNIYTYVAFTSSFAGTGGIVDAVVAEAEAMVEVVACFGALFESDFLRVRKPIFSVCGVNKLAMLGLSKARCGGEVSGWQAWVAGGGDVEKGRWCGRFVLRYRAQTFPHGLSCAVTFPGVEGEDAR